MTFKESGWGKGLKSGEGLRRGVTPQGVLLPPDLLVPPTPLSPAWFSLVFPGSPSTPTSDTWIPSCCSGFPFWPPHPTPQLQESGLFPAPSVVCFLLPSPSPCLPVSGVHTPSPVLPPSNLHLSPLPPSLWLSTPVPLTHSPQGMDNEAGGRGRGQEGQTPRNISAGGREWGGWLESLGRTPKSENSGLPSHEVGNLASWQG